MSWAFKCKTICPNLTHAHPGCPHLCRGIKSRVTIGQKGPKYPSYYPFSLPFSLCGCFTLQKRNLKLKWPLQKCLVYFLFHFKNVLSSFMKTGLDFLKLMIIFHPTLKKNTCWLNPLKAGVAGLQQLNQLNLLKTFLLRSTTSGHCCVF